MSYTCNTWTPAIFNFSKSTIYPRRYYFFWEYLINSWDTDFSTNFKPTYDWQINNELFLSNTFSCVLSMLFNEISLINMLVHAK